jgi:hypothetical protein
MPSRKEYTTPRRSRFFLAYDKAIPATSFASICRRAEIDIPPSTGRRWIKERETIGSPAIRRTRRLSSKLGQPRRISSPILSSLLDPKNPLHSCSYAEQAQQLPIEHSVQSKTLQQNLSKRLNARKYKRPRTPGIRLANKPIRVRFGNLHKGKSLDRYWRWIYFTDEVHMNSKELSDRPIYELRTAGSQTRFENMQETEMSDLNVTLHISAGISYFGKGHFKFYSDPVEPALKRIYKPSKPRQSSVETFEQYQEAVRAFEAAKNEAKIDTSMRIKGNSMTQLFYTKHILPDIIDRIDYLQAKYQHDFLLQEDNDGSHGTRSFNNPAAQLKQQRMVKIHDHPAQSPDLNPIESIWQIIKQRLRGGHWETVEEFKQAIMAEWRRITEAQIQKRIAEMPMRCDKLTTNDGNRIRTCLW